MSKFTSSITRKVTRVASASLITLILACITFNLPMRAALAATTVTNPAPAAQISFTFDDGLKSTSTQAAPTLAKYGLTGTDYVITGCVGMTTTPNKCRANTDTPYMTWAQIKALQTSGWEIGSHTVDHNCLASSAAQDPDDCQANALTTAQVDQELATSKATLAANGINATDFAPPYGDFNNNVLAQIAKYYATMRQFKNDANNANSWPYSDYYLQDFIVLEKTDTVATVEAAINKAITNKQWIILTFHDIETKPSRIPDDYQYGTSELDQIASYVKTKQTAGLIKNSNISQGLVSSTTNLMPNASFNSGIGAGWTTDDPTAIQANSGNNGSYPDATNAIKFVADNKTSHLFSPKIAVNNKNSYMIKSFLNVQALTSSSVGFYIDEYDASGNWISGQYKATEASTFVEDMNFSYTPSSVNVAQASLQFIVNGNSGISGYLDNVQWFPLTNNAGPTYTNLMPNSTFDGGLGAGWTTDGAPNIVADSANNGSPSDPVNSIKLTSTTNNIHLFSPKISVSSTQAYTINSYLNLKQITSGVFAYYIDEYDANGNWISGQYKLDKSAPTQGTISFSYTPSSTNVKQASLQLIVVANSNTLAYLDDVQWLLPQ